MPRWVRAMLNNVGQLKQDLTQIANETGAGLNAKISTYRSDPGTAIGLRAQSLASFTDSFKKGAATSNATGIARGQEGNVVSAADLGYEAVMTAGEKAFQSATFSTAISLHS